MAGELLELVVGEDKQLRARLTACVQQVIAGSFIADKSRVTQAEATRRFRIVEVLIRELRSEHGWAFDRIMDALPHALRCKLDGGFWDPRLDRNVWSGKTVA
jgi:hypothetical protein